MCTGAVFVSYLGDEGVACSNHRYHFIISYLLNVKCDGGNFVLRL